MITKTIRAIFRENLGVRQGERVLVFNDSPAEGEVMSAEEISRRMRLGDISLLTAEIGRAFTKKVTHLSYPAIGTHGAEPPEAAWSAAFGEKAVSGLKKAGLFSPLLNKECDAPDLKKVEAILAKQRRSSMDAVIALANFSTSHTRFRDLLTRVCGCRYASMPLFDASMLEGSMNVDWKALSKKTKALAKTVSFAETIEIRAPNGTHISLSKRGRKPLADTGILTRIGSFGNLPAGEVFLAPREGTANGKLVLAWAPSRELASPVSLTIKDGMVREVFGDEPYADVLRTKLAEREENANIAELGIGTNDRAKRPDNILEAEKILGTIHIALGDNSTFGGKVKTPFHQDFVFFRPSVTLIHADGTRTLLMKNGTLTPQQ